MTSRFVHVAIIYVSYLSLFNCTICVSDCLVVASSASISASLSATPNHGRQSLTSFRDAAHFSTAAKPRAHELSF